MTSFGIKLLCTPFISQEELVDTDGPTAEAVNIPAVFPGSNQEARFGAWLHQLFRNLSEDELLQVGMHGDDAGTHSIRKGVSTFVSTCPGGPPITSVFLRAGWSLGNVAQRYLHEGQGGDQFVGRLACGLPISKVEFAVLPPHFPPSCVEVDSINWAEIIPGYKYHNIKTRQAIPYMVASVVYHAEWLRQNLRSDHPLFMSRLFRDGYISRLLPHVQGGISYNSFTKLAATGIPPNLVIANELHAFKEKVIKHIY